MATVKRTMKRTRYACSIYRRHRLRVPFPFAESLFRPLLPAIILLDPQRARAIVSRQGGYRYIEKPLKLRKASNNPIKLFYVASFYQV